MGKTVQQVYKELPAGSHLSGGLALCLGSAVGVTWGLPAHLTPGVLLPCELKVGVTSRVLTILSSSFSAIQYGVFHSSPPS